MKTCKPYNAMNGWGDILWMKMEKTSKKKKYLTIQLGCQGLKFGPVKIYLNVWSEVKAIAYKKKFNVGQFVNIRGMMGQYVGRYDATKTSVNILEIAPWDPENDQHSKNRMTFVLVGHVVSFKDGKTEGQALISTSDQYPPLKVCIPPELAFDIKEGGFFRIKGAMQIEVDDFDDVVKPLRPVAEKIEEVEETTVSEASTEEDQEEVPEEDKEDDDIPF